jgi:hypothetical protein
VTGLRVGICVDDGVCASWGSVQVGFSSWGGQVKVVKSGCCGFLGFYPFMEQASAPRQREYTQGGKTFRLSSSYFF